MIDVRKAGNILRVSPFPAYLRDEFTFDRRERDPDTGKMVENTEAVYWMDEDGQTGFLPGGATSRLLNILERRKLKPV